MSTPSKKKAKAPKAKAIKATMTERANIDVRYTFADADKLRLGEELTQNITTRETLEKEFDSVKKDWKSKIDTFNTKISEIHGKLRDGFEMRPAAVVIHFNSAWDVKKKKPVKKQGTKCIVMAIEKSHVRDEPMSSTDYQSEMFQRKELEKKNEPPKPPSEPSGSPMNSMASKVAGKEENLNSPKIPEKGEQTSTAATA